ncbi:MAG: Hsp20/alpha crystallin family protein [Proteobacteria bacterium]|nr:Hsp20/alpha crystallin family protein [Pseudomonadota bacterium]MBU1640504.1 Hsp20/alpha crystallin family protein [Pseudomonadota bacterium]
MDFKKMVPWNWLVDEEGSEGKTIPIQHSDQLVPGGGQLQPFQQLQNEMDRLFNTFFRGFSPPFAGLGNIPSLRFPGMPEGLLKPTVDISAGDKEYSISVEVPGVDDKDVKIEVVNNNLIISGEKKQEKEEKDKNFYRVERCYGSFRRVLSLPEDADQDTIKANFKKGVLNLTIPRKALPASAVKKIKIENKD